MRLALISFCLFLSYLVKGQACTTIGQTPSTAFPVCGTKSFAQQTVPLCGFHIMPSPCKADNVMDTNPFWYKFTCFQDGTLDFLITPNNLGDDYDWELYDYTGHNPNEVYVDVRLPIACNWSGEKGLTGTSASAGQQFVCAGYGKPLYSKQPVLTKGHNYLLLVSHFDPFTNSTDGYKLDFTGGTAIITDSTTPHMIAVTANCAGDKARVKLNKKMLCKTIAPDGSDFYFDGNSVGIVAATGIGCSEKFDTDSIELSLNKALDPGSYTLKIKPGTDGNTVLDICDNGLPYSEELQLTVLPRVPTPMDSMATVSCAPNELKLIFSKDMLCNSIAADGSDFIITGTYPITIIGAAGNCQGTGTKEITITLDQPLYLKGDFQLKLKAGNDGNTILDECSEETPAGSSLSFSVKDTVNAVFTYSKQYGCSEDIVQYNHPGGNEINSWSWDLDDHFKSSEQSPQARYTRFNEKSVQLIVSNGFCSDTTSQSILLDNYIKADFEVAADNCPLDTIPFISHAVGKIISHSWDFGDGNPADIQYPVHAYARTAATRDFKIRYTVTDSIGCSSTIEKSTRIYVSCLIDVPNAFSPNGDGVNDVLYPLNAVKAEQLNFTVYNRWGQVVFQTNNWKKGWDGRLNSIVQTSGMYIWTLTYTDRDSKKQFSKKGNTVLIR